MIGPYFSDGLESNYCQLEVSTKQAIFVDSSISDTIRTCIVLGNHRAAMKVKTEFKVLKLPLYSILLKEVSLGGARYNIHSTASLTV